MTMMRMTSALFALFPLLAGCLGGSSTDPTEPWTGALTDEDCADLAASCEGDHDGACHELSAACTDADLDAAHRCAELHDACAADHADAVCEDVTVLCQEEQEHDGDADGEHDGDLDGEHDGDADGEHDGQHDGDADGHDGDADGHDGDADGHDGDADGRDGDADGHDGDADGHDGDADGHDGDADGEHDGDADGEHDGDVVAPVCEGTHPIVNGDVRSCAEGSTYCAAIDACFAGDVAAACCGAHG